MLQTQKLLKSRKLSDKCLSNYIQTRTQVRHLPQPFSLLLITGDESAAEKFKQVNRAYEVLSDDTKRDIYNT